MRSGAPFTRLSSLLVWFVVLLPVACSSHTQPPPPTGHTKAAADQQVYIYPQTEVADIKTFDPALSSDYNSTVAIDLVFTGLVQLDDQLRVQPQLAQSWHQAADGMSWTFHLKPHLTFSDATPLTSQDVAYSLDRALEPGLQSTTAPIYLALVKDSQKRLAGTIPTLVGKSILTPDASTVVLLTTKKAAYFLNALTYSCSYVVQKRLIDRYGQQQFTDHLPEGGGAGPFVVSEYIHGQHIVFAPNPNYYGPRPQLRKVIMPFYKEVATAYRAYQVGQVSHTGTYSIPTSQLPEAEHLPKEFHRVPMLVVNYYAMNYLVKPFDNLHIRQAFALAINKDQIVHAIYKDLYLPTNHIVPQGMPGYTPTLTGPDGTTRTSGNPEQARAFLQQGLHEEGWSAISQMPPITLTYWTGSQDLENEITTVRQMWQRVLGVTVIADPLDFNRELSEIVTHRLQFWAIGWSADYPDPQDWLTLQFGKGVPNNTMNYGQNTSATAAQQQAVQQALENADRQPDPPTRLKQYAQAEQQLVKDVAWLPMEQVRLGLLVKPCVQGLVFNASGLTPPDDWSRVYISTDTPCSHPS